MASRSRLLLSLVALGLQATLRGQAGPPDTGYPTGLRLPSAAEQAWMEANLIQVERVLPNRLALARLAEDRLRKGQPLAPEDLARLAVAQDGAEFQGRTGDGSRTVAMALRAEKGEGTFSTADGVTPWFPKIGSQISNSCACFSTTYYTMTSQVARLRGWNAKADTTGACVFSTKFTYNQLNGGGDNGTSQVGAYQVMLAAGCPTLQDLPSDSDILGWPLTAAVWERALPYRMAQVGSVGSLNTDAGLANAKQLLANGYLLNYGTDIYQWKYGTLGNDPATSADDWLFAPGVPTTQRSVCTYLDTTAGDSGHGMTIVGYNDDVWVDLNGNGVVDAGEKGAFLIANSWGTSWGNGGFMWLAYDALKAVSAVAGAPAPSTRAAALWSNVAYWMSANPAYSPTLVGEATLSTVNRSGISMYLGNGSATTTTPASPTTPYVVRNFGGALAFNGTATAVPATFAFDASGLVTGTAGSRWFLGIRDNDTTGRPCTVSSVSFIDGAGVVTAFTGTTPAGGLPLLLENATGYAFADNALSSAVAPSITQQPQNATANLGSPAIFMVTGKGSYPLTYQWYQNGAPIAGANGANLTTANTTLADNGSTYTVTLTNGAGKVTSAGATLNVAAAAPAFTKQPASTTVVQGQTATFTATATGTAPLAYQWARNGTSISGSTYTANTTPAATLADNGSTFTVTVTNALGQAVSTKATLTVTPAAAPTITTQPSAQTVTVGATAAFTVKNTGSTPLTYQWNRNGTPIAGANLATYTTPATVMGDNGASFTVTLTNIAGQITSSAAVLTVKAVAPSITTQPASQSILAGQTATFSVAAGGTAPFTYQWYLNGAAIAGATSSSWTTAAAAVADSGSLYTVTVGNSAGQVTSAAATLTVKTAAPTLTTQPASQTVTVGQSATFSVTPAGTAPFTFQWNANGVAIPGAASSSYSTPATTLADNGTLFTVTVGNAAGQVTSAAATLTVQALVPPSLTTQPASLVALWGGIATFTVQASGSALTYQWFRNGSPLAGATAASFTTGVLAKADIGASYTVVVANGAGSVTSQAAILTLRTLDLNQDGSMDLFDVLALVRYMGTTGLQPSSSTNPNDPRMADLNGDGTVDAADLAILLANR
jgi:hypothetical protein